MENVSSSNGLEKRPRLAFRNTDGSHFPCWRQTSLGCIIEPYSEKVYGEHDYEVLTSSREGLQRQEDHFGSKQRHDTDGYNIIPFGYCTYRNRSDDGKFAFNINTISEKAIVSKFYPVFRFTNANSTFMAEFLNSSPRVKKKLSVLAVGTSQVVLSFAALKAAKFDLPCKDEQDKIAAFLECLNTRIENQRTLVVALKKYKRGVVKALISGSLTFTDADHKKWETVSLAEIFNISAGGDIDRENSSSSYSANHPYPVFANALTNSGLYGYANYFKIEGDSITVSGRGEVGHAIARHCKYVPIVRLLSLVPKHDDDVDFFAYMINATSIYIESTGVPQLTSPQLGAVKVLRPPVSEQKRISSFLLKLDAKIEKEERLILRMEKVKASMLQQLFI